MQGGRNMGKYAPPYEITNKMLDYVASISEKVGRVSERSGLTSRPASEKEQPDTLHLFFAAHRG